MGAWFENRELAGKYHGGCQDPAPLLEPLGEFLGRCDCCKGSTLWLSGEHLAAGAFGYRLPQHCFNSAYNMECTSHAGQGWLLHRPMKRKDQRTLPLSLPREDAAWLPSGSAFGCGSLCSMSDPVGKLSGVYEG